MSKKDKKPKKPKAPIVEDSYLWQHVIQDIEPLHQPYSSAKIPAQEPSSSVEVNAKEPLLTHDIPPKQAPSYEIQTGDSRDVNRAMAKQIKAGKYPIDMKLDLHGKTQVQAHQLLEKTVLQAYHAGMRCILVITGKGKFSQAGGVLRKQLSHWLNEQAICPYVLMVQEASPSDGGSGAFYVMIKRKR